MDALYSYRHDLPRLIEEINRRKLFIEVPDSVPLDLFDTYQTCRVLDEFILDFFAEPRVRLSESAIQDSIDQILTDFKNNILKKLFNEKEAFLNISSKKRKGFKNIFEFAQCQNLYLSNRYVNLISESLGHSLEDIAFLSHLVFIPEKILKIKLKGIKGIRFDYLG